jgi:hypothetical protein
MVRPVDRHLNGDSRRLGGDQVMNMKVTKGHRPLAEDEVTSSQSNKIHQGGDQVMIMVRLPDKRASIEVIYAKTTVVPQTAARIRWLIRLVWEAWTHITAEVKKVSCKGEG